jgi:hypothetical protein
LTPFVEKQASFRLGGGPGDVDTELVDGLPLLRSASSVPEVEQPARRRAAAAATKRCTVRLVSVVRLMEWGEIAVT